MNNDAYNSVGE